MEHSSLDPWFGIHEWVGLTLHYSTSLYIKDLSTHILVLKPIPYKYQEMTLIKFWGSQKLHADVFLHGAISPKPHIIQGSTVLDYGTLLEERV